MAPTTTTKEEEENYLNEGVCYELHKKYIINQLKTIDGSFEGAMTQHLKMSGVYWSLCALYLLLPTTTTTNNMDQKQFLSLNELLQENDISTKDLFEWMESCFDETTGGYGGDCGHDGHLLYTLSALQIMALLQTTTTNELVNPKRRNQIVNFIRQCQLPNGSFVGDINSNAYSFINAPWAGEVDTRFTYCAISSLYLLGYRPYFCKNDNKKENDIESVINLQKAREYILSCQNVHLDGGFGSCAGAESHAGQAFCCVGALEMMGYYHGQSSSMDDFQQRQDKLLWWLSERQCDSGGLNGRSEKQADVCYSWWIVSCLAILQPQQQKQEATTPQQWVISTPRLVNFIITCQDTVDGGIADRPMDMPDVYHTFFGLAGLSLMNQLFFKSETIDHDPFKINPVFALPVSVVERLGLV